MAILSAAIVTSIMAYDIAIKRAAFADQALDAYNSKFSEQERTGGKWDAFRHSYTSARFEQSYNETTSKFLGDANEAGRLANPNDSRNMDYYNNDKGISYGKQSSGPYNFDAIDANLADIIKNAINSDQLITDKDDPRIVGYEDIHDPYIPTMEALQEFGNNSYDGATTLFKGMWDWVVGGGSGSPNGNSGGGGGSGGSGGNGGGSNGEFGGSGGSNAPGGGNGPKLPPNGNGPGDQGSPLVLDLDGDGIELVELGSFGSYFDLRGDGQAVLTGWVGSDDGLLAIDINGNGRIDGVGELFGNQTTDGFTQLRAYDDNQDGLIDSQDTVFNQLLVWRDVNSDGYSQSSELQTLSDYNIVSISVNADRLVDTKIQGNTITHEARYTLNDGTSREIVDAWFSYDVGNTRNNQDYSLDIRAAFMPTLRGYGDLKDLHMAVSLDSGSEVDSLMSQLISIYDTRTLTSSLTDWSGYEQQVKDLLYNWADVDTTVTGSRGNYVDAQAIAFYEVFTGEAFSQYNQPNPLPEAGQYVEAVVDHIVTHSAVQILAQLDKSPFEDLYYSIYDGSVSGDLTLTQAGIEDVRDLAISSVDKVSIWTHYAQYIGYTRGFANLTVDEITTLDLAVLATNEASLSDWQDVVTNMTVNLGSIIETSSDWGSFEIYYDNLQTGTSGNDVITDANTNGNNDNEFLGLSGDDTIYALDGHDKINAGSGNDTLIGGEGDDFLLGGTGNDTYIYHSGNDTISEVNGDGYDEIIIASSTNLTQANLQDMYRNGNDLILLFDNGDFITIDNYNGVDSRIEKIIFEADNYEIDLQNILEETFYGTSKTDTLEIEGTLLQTLTAYGYASNDVLKISGAAAKFYGGDGYDDLIGDYLNDELHGEKGDDYLIGYGGDDHLYGGDGNDVLDGGQGNDSLEGGKHDDVYKFRVGSGADTIYDLHISTTEGRNDSIQLEGVIQSDIIVSRGDNDDLILKIQNTTDILTIKKQEFYGGNHAQIETVNFDDGSSWNAADLRYLSIQTSTTSGDDIIRGFRYDETIDGGLGNDYLSGGNGNDTYVWSLNEGSDIIEDIVPVLCRFGLLFLSIF